MIGFVEAMWRNNPVSTRPQKVAPIIKGAALAALICTSACHLLLGYDDSEGETSGPFDSSPGGGGANGGSAGSPQGTGTPAGVGGSWDCQDVEQSAFAMPVPGGVPHGDDFSNRQVTLDRWGARFFVENEGGYVGDTACKATLCPGELRLEAGPPGIGSYAWWHLPNGQSGPIIYQNVSGNFAFEADIELDPTGLLSTAGAGLIVRDPEIDNHYIYYAFGHDDDSPAHVRQTAARVRDPNRPGNSDSLPLGAPQEATSSRARLLVCRVGQWFALSRRLSGDDDVVETHGFFRASTWGFESVNVLEVGLSAHWYESDGNAIGGIFRNVRFHPAPESHADCAKLLNDATP